MLVLEFQCVFESIVDGIVDTTLCYTLTLRYEFLLPHCAACLQYVVSSRNGSGVAIMLYPDLIHAIT